MTDFEFTIVATGLSLEDDDWQDRFIDAGCDDALAGVQRGLFVLRFDREAANLSEAIESAMHDVEAAGATITRIEPDPMVSASDIAERSGLSRQLVSLYANGSRGSDFPAPAACVTTPKPLWKWHAVAKWLADNNKLDVEIAEHAKVIDQFNKRIDENTDKVALGEAPRTSSIVRTASRYTAPDFYMRRMASSLKPATTKQFQTDVSAIEPWGAEYLRSPNNQAGACL